MFAVWPGRFLKKDFGPSGPLERYKKTREKHTPLTPTNQQLWLMFRLGTRDTVVAGVGIADGSRAKYDVGI